LRVLLLGPFSWNRDCLDCNSLTLCILAPLNAQRPASVSSPSYSLLALLATAHVCGGRPVATEVCACDIFSFHRSDILLVTCCMISSEKGRRIAHIIIPVNINNNSTRLLRNWSCLGAFNRSGDHQGLSVSRLVRTDCHTGDDRSATHLANFV
jgi:hypothetical protein